MIHIAYFYRPRSVAVDGWKDRRTVICDERGSLRVTPSQLDELRANYRYIGFWELGKAPASVWNEARAT